MGQIAEELRNEFIFCLVMKCHPKKKLWEIASLHVAHDAKFPSFFFFWMMPPSPNKTNKFIRHYFIISKHT
jgi:hypothetical protein